MGLREALRGGDGARNFPRHAGWGGDGARKIHAGRGRRSHPLAPLRPIAIPTQLLSSFVIVYEDILVCKMMKFK